VGKLRPTALIALTFILVGTARGSVPSYLDQSQSVAQTTALNPDASETHSVTWTGVNVTADTATVQTLEFFLAGDGGFIDGGFEAAKVQVAGVQTPLPADVQPTQTITKKVFFPPPASPAKYVVVETEQTQPTPAPANWQLFVMPLIPVVAPGSPAPQPPPPLQLSFPVNIAPNGPATIVETTGPKGNSHPRMWLPVQVQCFGNDPVIVHTLTVRIGQFLPGFVTLVTDAITVEATVPPCQSTLVNLFERIPFALNNKPTVIDMDIDYTDVTTQTQGTVSAQFPVTFDTPQQLLAPLLGTFNYFNGPGQTLDNDHATHMSEKWAYDILKIDGAGSTHQFVPGDVPLVNSNFYCWGKPVYAMTSGTVVGSLGTSTDNNAYQKDGNGPPNFVTIQDDVSGLLTFYAHFQQNSVVPVGTHVTAGVTQIGLLGNSGGGGSSEPHLHIEAIVIDATGHHKGRPMAFGNLYSASNNNKQITGVPIAPHNYHSK
jgi:hypothetical protein